LDKYGNFSAKNLAFFKMTNVIKMKDRLTIL
jgi:hypothetical protein